MRSFKREQATLFVVSTHIATAFISKMRICFFGDFIELVNLPVGGFFLTAEQEYRHDQYAL